MQVTDYDFYPNVFIGGVAIAMSVNALRIKMDELEAQGWTVHMMPQSHGAPSVYFLEPVSPNQKFADQIQDFRNWYTEAFKEMHRLIDECDKAEAKALELIAKYPVKTQAVQILVD